MPSFENFEIFDKFEKDTTMLLKIHLQDVISSNKSGVMCMYDVVSKYFREFRQFRQNDHFAKVHRSGSQSFHCAKCNFSSTTQPSNPSLVCGSYPILHSFYLSQNILLVISPISPYSNIILILLSTLLSLYLVVVLLYISIIKPTPRYVFSSYLQHLTVQITTFLLYSLFFSSNILEKLWSMTFIHFYKSIGWFK